MKIERLLISILSSICFYGILDFFNVVNFSKYNSYLLPIMQNKTINLISKCLLLTIFMFLFSFLIKRKREKSIIQYEICVYSLCIFLFVELGYSIFIKDVKMSFSSHISLLFCIFFSSYLYFYSLFYLDVVKYKRQY